MKTSGLHYSDNAVISQESICYPFGRIDKMHIQGPCRVQLKKSTHTLFLMEGFQNNQGKNSVNHNIWVDRQKMPSRRHVSHVADWVPAGCNLDAAFYDEGTLRCMAVTISPTLTTYFNGTQRHTGSLSPALNIRNPLLQLAGQQLMQPQDEFYASTLMLTMLMEAAHAHATPLPIQNKNDPLTDQKKQQLLEYIEDNLGNKISLREMAANVGMSLYYFAHTFQQHFQQSPYQYVLERRLHNAQQRLLRTHLTMTEIAMDCGFSSPAQFSSRFRQRFGASPSYFRQTHAPENSKM